MKDKPIHSQREERDALGTKYVDDAALYGIHTARAMENFAFGFQTVHPALIHAYGDVKYVCTQVNSELYSWLSPEKIQAILTACEEMSLGKLDAAIRVDALQGGAGTSTHLNVNEVLTNRALQLLGHQPGEYSIISPLNDLNKHQSTNDTYPTALKLASIRMLRTLEDSVVQLQEAFQEKEKQFASIVKIGRTQWQDAVLTTLGREMGAYAEVFTRDRWRIYKCEERMRVINLGGTAIGTGLGAPRDFIFRATDALRARTGIGFARAENLIDATQNTDVFVEVSGIIKALAVSLHKIASDIRIMSSGPDAGFNEINIPARQAGSSIMPGKVNPVIPESVSQIAMLIMGYDQVIAQACSSGVLELNAFLPLMAHCLLSSLQLLERACYSFNHNCVQGITANEDVCKQHVETSSATATAFVPVFGYDQVAQFVQAAADAGVPLKTYLLNENIITKEQFIQYTSPESVTRLGMPKQV